MRSLAHATVLLALCAGCAVHDQIQYFEVFDPESGNVNYYRMTITGHGALGAEYQMQAGYFSAASVDVLRGQMPAMPEVDLPLEQDAAFDAVVDRYYQSLVGAADGLSAEGIDPQATPDEAVLARARLVWFGQLSPADVAAMGMHASTNPFQFRKLVFWTTAQNVDLRQFGTEIDAIVASATQLIRAQKTAAKQRQARRDGLRRFLDDVMKSNPALEPYTGLIDMLFGAGGPAPAPAQSQEEGT